MSIEPIVTQYPRTPVPRCGTFDSWEMSSWGISINIFWTDPEWVILLNGLCQLAGGHVSRTVWVKSWVARCTQHAAKVGWETNCRWLLVSIYLSLVVSLSEWWETKRDLLWSTYVPVARVWRGIGHHCPKGYWTPVRYTFLCRPPYHMADILHNCCQSSNWVPICTYGCDHLA